MKGEIVIGVKSLLLTKVLFFIKVKTWQGHLEQDNQGTSPPETPQLSPLPSLSLLRERIREMV